MTTTPAITSVTSSIGNSNSIASGFSGFSGAVGATGATGPQGAGYNTVYRTGDGATSSTTTVAADDTLLFTASANKHYRFRAVLQFSTVSNAGVKISLLSSITGATVYYGGFTTMTGGTFGGLSDIATAFNTALTCSSAANNEVIIEGFILNGSVGGTVTIGFARATGAGSTTIKGAARLEYEQLN